MSNIIPIVSSSPPPFDDDGGWDDDDEDFGNFASAPNISAKEDDKSSPPYNNDSFEVDWSSADAFHDPELSTNSLSASKVGKAPINGLIDEPPETNKTSCLEDVTKRDEQHKHFNNHSESDVGGDSSCIERDKEEELVQNNVSDIPTTASSCMPTLDPHLSQKSQTHSTVEESDSGMTNSEESLALAASKTNESVISFTSTTDSGVFSSDLSPSSYPESSSTIQENCDNIFSPNTNLHFTAESSGNACKSLSQSEEPEKPSADLKAGEKPSQDQVEIQQGSFSDNCGNGDDDGDWGDFNEAYADVEENSTSNDVSFSSFNNGNIKHSLSTAENINDEDSENITQNGLSLGEEGGEKNIGQGGCEIPSKNLSEEKSKHKQSHNVSNDSPSSFVPVVSDTAASSEHSGHPLPENFQNENNHEESNSCQTEKSNIVRDGDGIDDAAAEESESITNLKETVSVEKSSLHSPDRGSPSATEEFPESDITENTEGRNISPSQWQTESRTEELDENSRFENKSPCNKDSREVCNNDLRLTCQENSSTVDIMKDNESNVSSCEAVNEDITPDSITQKKNKDNHEDGDFDDEEFGSFSSMGLEKKKSDLSDEVTPINFRTSVCEDEVDGHNEDSGKEEPPPFDDDDDDGFGDFGDFNSTQSARPPEEDDDFGSFDSELKSKAESSGLADDDFGDFGDANVAGNQDGGWADFGSSTTTASEGQPNSFSNAFSTSEPEAETTTTTSTGADQGKTKIVLAVEKCFPARVSMPSPVSFRQEDSSSGQSQLKTGEVTMSSELARPELEETEGQEEVEGKVTALDVVIELGLANPLEAKQQTWTVVQHPAKKDPQVRVWSQMKDVDASHALGYAWPTSHCSQEIFSTLHIDTQNILFTQKKQAVPFFASGLGILEPTRGGNVAEAKKEKATGMGLPLQPTLLDVTASSKQSPTTVAQDIPPVDFDWSVSGLTNPLTANTLDLDFLVVQGSDSVEKTSVFKSDTQDATTHQPGLQPLEEMLKKSTPTARLATQENLSPEAQKILAKMPDLSFMQSKVLMFPVKQ